MNPAELAIVTLLDAHFRRSTISPVEWCETVRRMKGGRRFSFDYAPYQREIFESFFDEKVAVTVMALPSRGGKTELCTNLFGYSIAERPKEMIMARPSQKSVETYSKNEFQGKLINPTPELAEILPDGSGRRIGNNTISSKYFPGGFINFIGMNSGSVMRTVQGEVIVVDEADACKSEETDEGDKVAGVFGRGDEYANPIKVLTSYPLYAGDSIVWKWLGESDWRKWHVKHRCGKRYVLHRNQIRWKKGEADKAQLICPGCEEPIPPAMWRKMWRSGEWVATRPFKGIRGYQMSGMSWPHPVPRAYKNFFHWIAARTEAAEAAANPEKAKMELVNRFDSEPFQPAEVAKADPSDLVTKREEYEYEGEIPEGILSIVFGADVQGNRLELEFVGVGDEDQTWGLGYHIIPGRPERQATWDKLSELIAKKWQHPKLGEIGIDGGMIDSKFRPDNVRAWAIKHRTKHIFAVIGSTVLGKPIVGKPKRDLVTIGTRKRQVQIYEIGTHEAKDRIYQRLLLDKPDGAEFPHGYMHYPVADCYDEKYFEGLTVEIPALKRGGDGEWYRHFSAKSGQRNEPLDLRVYAMAAHIVARPPMRARLAKIRPKTLSKDDKPEDFEDKKRKNRRNWRIGATTLRRGATY